MIHKVRVEGDGLYCGDTSSAVQMVNLISSILFCSHKMKS